jgi:DNA-binding NarL/FixJ family response regulator
MDAEETDVGGSDGRPVTMTDVFGAVERSVESLIVIRLPETTISAANDAARDLFDDRSATLVGRRFSSLFHGADEVHANIALSALASRAIDSYCARRRLANRADAVARTCVRALDVGGERIALGFAAPADGALPFDVVEERLIAARLIRGPDADAPNSSLVRSSDRHATVENSFTILDRLPPREREIVSALLQGQRTAAIAESMFLSNSTVRSHLSAIFKAFGVHSQTELLSMLRSQSSSAGISAARHPT